MRRRKYQDDEAEKERHELAFRIHKTSKTEQKLTAKSFIVDIRPGSKYPSDERNKLFSYSIKATLNTTTLGIRMYSTELQLWKNSKGSTCCPMFLCKWDSTADIFL